MTEIEVLADQLDELLEEGAVDPEDALEIALVAGMVARLGGDPELLAEAEAWRRGPGADLLREAWANLDVDGILAAFDDATDGSTGDEEVEEAVLDIDELVAGAIWSGKGHAVARIARHAAASVRMMPEVFAFLAPDAAALVALESVGTEYALYDFWFAIDAAARELAAQEA